MTLSYSARNGTPLIGATSPIQLSSFAGWGVYQNVPPHQGANFAPYGVSGTNIQFGLINDEEYNPDLQWREAIRTYDVMRRSDPQIFSTLLICELPIRSAEWKVAPGTADPRDIEIASFIDTNLFHTMERTWDDILRHALMMNAYGFMLFEVVHQNVNGQTLLKDIAPRHPRTINRWWTDKENNLIGVRQWAWRGGSVEFIDLPEDVLMHLSYRQEGQNYEGISVLRSAYKAWWYKQNYERIQAVGFEREHVGIPVITLPEGFGRKDIDRAEAIGRNVRSHEQAYVTLPPGWTLEWMKSKGSERKGSTLLETMYYLDRQIQQNVLAQFLSLGTTDVGSYALSNDQSRVFLMSLQSTARYIAQQFNKKVIRKLVNYNYEGVAVYPELLSQKIHAYNFNDVVAALSNLVGMGIMPVTPELEDYVHDLLGVPAPPKSVIETTNPSLSRDTRQQAIDQRRQPSPATDLGQPGESRNESSGAVGFHEVYDTDAFRRMSGPQRESYIRMAQEAGRPRSIVRLGTPFQFASAPRTDTRQQQRLERRWLASEQGRRAAVQAYNDLSDELEEALAERV